MPNNKTLVKFNVKNAKFALPAADAAGWAAPVPFGTSKKIALEANSSSKKLYGDGRVILMLVNDKGKTGTLTLNNICEEYEIAMKRKRKLAVGLADVKQNANVPHCIYFETDGADDASNRITAKTWLYMVTSTRPSESYDQDTDELNESSFDIPLEIAGLPILTADGEPYKEKGVEIYAWQLTVTPDDPAYDTFGDAVVLPTMPTEA